MGRRSSENGVSAQKSEQQYLEVCEKHKKMEIEFG